MRLFGSRVVDVRRVPAVARGQVVAIGVKEPAARLTVGPHTTAQRLTPQCQMGWNRKGFSFGLFYQRRQTHGQLVDDVHEPVIGFLAKLAFRCQLYTKVLPLCFNSA